MRRGICLGCVHMYVRVCESALVPMMGNTKLENQKGYMHVRESVSQIQLKETETMS